jgi:D-sedoheptulose 7-phosphate isomerase
MRDYTNGIEQYFGDVKAVLDKVDLGAVNEAMKVIVSAYHKDATIYTFGNGGSATTASHFCCDFNKGISEEAGKKFRMICLNDNTATLMAIANDISYEEVFRFQLQGILREGDLVIGISGSGNSPNVLNAVRYAKERGNLTIGITGYDGGELMRLVDYRMHVPVNDMQIAEDVHMIFDHMMVRVLLDDGL